MYQQKKWKVFQRDLSPKIRQRTRSGQLHTRNECSSLGENIGVDIVSRPVDKDSNCTDLCCVLCLYVVPLTIPLWCHQPSLVQRNQCASVEPCMHQFGTVLDCCMYMIHILQLLLYCTHIQCWICHAPVHGTRFNYWLGFVVFFACCIICLMISSACSECFVCLCSNYPNCFVLTTLTWKLEHTLELKHVCTI